jgi:Origin of replication binding protein
MTASNKMFAISVNAGIIGKPAAAARVDRGKGWQPFDLSAGEVADAILEGFAIAPQYRGGHRKTANFIKSGFLAADVDSGMTLDEANHHAFVRHYAGLINTTASHTAERHRFRIVFLLDEAILTASDWAGAQLGLALMLGSDRSATDAARLFYGNSRAVIFQIGRTIPPAVVADLIARGRDARASRSPLDGRQLPVDSVRRIVGPELVKVAGGELVRMDEIGIGMPVHCPHHDDDDPSAFTLRSRSGQPGIHCSACKVTFWSSAAGDDYDFKGFDRLCEAKQVETVQSDVEPEGLDRFFPPEPTFLRHRQAFLPAFPYAPGITMVRSAKGSGKTEALKGLLADIRAGRYRADIARKDQINSVLLIGHRQSLIREAAAKLGLRCYLDAEDTDGGLRTLAVCLDSLPKYNESNGGGRPKNFDLVIIDESEQVLAHLLSDTIEKRYGVERCFDALMYEVANAKAVIALDADLGLVTAHAMQTMRPQDWTSRCRIILNQPVVPTERRVMRLHRDTKFLEREVIEAVRRGERCFITSNSKNFIDVAHKMILTECGEDVVMRVITSDNSRDDATVRFVKNIKTEILKVQVVLGSPSIGTGIDITFPDGACRVDRVFGFFFSFVNTHADIDQQLSRVRNPGSIDVWISPTTFQFTSNVDVIKDDLARAYVVKRAVRGRRPDGMVEYNRDDPLLMICAHVTALRRASMNRLVPLFCELREHSGWAIERVGQEAETSPFSSAKTMLVAERTEKLLKAPTLLDVDFMELEALVSSGASLTDDERVAYQKNHFERTVGVTLDRELIRMNGDGRLVDRIAALAEILSIWSTDHGRESIDARLEPTLDPKGRLQETKPEILVAVLTRAAGLTPAEGFDANVTVSVDSISGFLAICRDNRTVIEEILGEPLRKDFEAKPVGQLNRFLRRMGLKAVKVKTKKLAGRKLRSYAVPRDLLDKMTALARSYLDVRAREEKEKETSTISGREAAKISA